MSGPEDAASYVGTSDERAIYPGRMARIVEHE